ncbi:MAG: tripartite tricarboxylate transporter substrate binding protein, partial [bacterium]
MKHYAIASAVALAALAGLSLHTLPATAQTWPAKPIRVIVPWPGGGSNDAAAGPGAPQMSEARGGPLGWENRAGAARPLGAAVGGGAP